MGLTLKYVQKTPAGTFRYRRRVPDDLKAVIGKRELTEFLGDTQKQAATRYVKTHGKFEKILKDALLKSAGATNVPKKELSEFEIWQGLRTRLREMGFDPYWQGVTDPHDPQDEGFLRDITADNLAAQYPVEDETGYPLVEDRQESALINAIRNGIPVVQMPDKAKRNTKATLEFFTRQATNFGQVFERKLDDKTAAEIAKPDGIRVLEEREAATKKRQEEKRKEFLKAAEDDERLSNR